jgi:GT2 family glycosyltransferase
MVLPLRYPSLIFLLSAVGFCFLDALRLDAFPTTSVRCTIPEMTTAASPAPPKVYVVLVSWNGWQHTLECLESLFRSEFRNFEIVVIDNASSDASADQIDSWAQGNQSLPPPADATMARYSVPPIPKPVPFARLSLGQLEPPSVSQPSPRLTLIDAGSNLGFGGANNAALEYVAKRGDAGCIWLLNNDTVVAPETMSKMVETAERTAAGIVGSVVRYYSDPKKVQAFGGGHFSSLTGSARLSSSSHRRPVNFIFGASFLIRGSTYERLGGFDENIFMYFEEVEYCIRARQQRIPMAVSEAQVFHKSGVSTADSYLKWKYIYQSRVYTMLKHFGIGAWVLFTSLNWLTNVVSPSTDAGKRKAAREAFTVLTQALAESLRR